MDKKFKLLKNKPTEPIEASSFWNCCPLKMQFLPDSECTEGRPVLNKDRLKKAPRCQFWINSKPHNYCFWKYVHDKSNLQGEMPELQQSELAKLFGWSNTKAHFVLKEAVEDLVKLLKLDGLNDEMLDDYDIESELSLQFNSLFDENA